ncbi:hypothetical protein IWX50DRAFT_615748 [Phyllosticta citricarpa]
MSNQGYYQGGPQYPPQSYGPPQPGYGQPPYGGYPQQPVPSPTSPWIQAPSLTRSVQMQYQQGPPQQVIVKEKKDRGCLGTCLAVLCCCFVCEEGLRRGVLLSAPCRNRPTAFVRRSPNIRNSRPSLRLYKDRLPDPS